MSGFFSTWKIEICSERKRAKNWTINEGEAAWKGRNCKGIYSDWSSGNGTGQYQKRIHVSERPKPGATEKFAGSLAGKESFFEKNIYIPSSNFCSLMISL